MANKWRELTRKVRNDKAGTVDDMVDQCGFENDFRSDKPQFGWHGTGYVNDCDNMCDDIKPVKTADDMRAVLEEFLFLVKTKFTKKDENDNGFYIHLFYYIFYLLISLMINFRRKSQR